jgi:hypothetical protein
MKISVPTAFLLVKFKDSPSEPMTNAAAERMFTAAGRGTMNVVDWFDDNCHGNVDMQENAVFGWFSLGDTLAEYNAKRADGRYGRTAIIDLARGAAAAAKVDLSKFAMVVVVTNEGVDLFGGSGFACCNAVTAGVPFWAVQVAPSVLCQEMIHGIGVYEHTRRHGSDADYTDPYDVMSMFAAWPGRHPNDPNLPVGPGLNAAFMKRCGWLDPARGTTGGLETKLRPLHRRDLPGPLYALVGDTYYVEYRPSSRWDTGFASVVLVHYIKNNTSYLAAELRAGSPAFTWGDPRTPFEAYGSIAVDAIDDRAETATISTFFRPARPIPSAGPAFSLFASELADGAGLAIVGGKIVKIPPNSPALELLEAAAAVVNAEALEIAPAVQTTARAQIYTQALESIEEAREHITGASSVLDHMTMDAARAFHKQRRKGTRRANEALRGRAAKTRRRSR